MGNGIHLFPNQGNSSVSDEAYGGSWNGETTTAPSKNAVYDKIETIFPINVKSNSISSLVGDGTTDDSAALTALIAGVPAGSTLFLPPGYSFKVSGVSIDKQLTFFGTSTTFKTTSDAVMLTIAASGVKFIGIDFRGDAVTTKTSQKGIYVDTQVRWNVSFCNFYDFGGAGIHGLNTNTSGYISQSVNNCLFSNCKNNTDSAVGLWLGAGCEYVNVDSCNSDNNNIGTLNTGGNNTYTAWVSTSDRIGGKVDAGTNNGHGKFIASTFNHCGAYALWIKDTSLGFSIEGCHLYGGVLKFENSSGVKVTGGIMSVQEIWFENSIVSLNNLTMDSTAPNTNTITNNYNTTTGYGLWFNNINIDGTYSADYNTTFPGNSPTISQEFTIEVPITKANILAMFGAEVTVVPAVAGAVLEFISAVLIYDYSTATYGAGGDISLFYVGGAAVSTTITAANGFGAAGDKVFSMASLNAAGGYTMPVNTGLSIKNITGAFTDPGTAAGVGRLHITYKKHITGL